MITRNGKIANLPLEIRDTMNAFISEGHTAEEILEWLNDEPEVIAILKSKFGRRPVSEQELSEWRSGGYEEWLASRAALAEASAFTEKGECIAHSGIRAGHLLTVITARWATLIEQWGTMDATQFAAAKRDLGDFTKSAIALRRIELQTARSEMDRERLRLLAEKKAAASSSSKSSTAASKSSSPESDSDNGDGAEPGAASSPESSCELGKQSQRPNSAPPSASPKSESEDSPSRPTPATTPSVSSEVAVPAGRRKHWKPGFSRGSGSRRRSSRSRARPDPRLQKDAKPLRPALIGVIAT